LPRAPLKQTMNTPPRRPLFVQRYTDQQEATRDELASGLRAATAAIAPKYFYDALGSRLFDAITDLPEYYPTRTEAAILVKHAPAIAAAVGTGRALVDLGAGNCEKAGRLFAVLKPDRYVAVDISVEYLRNALVCLQREHPQMVMLGVGLDFSQSLELPSEVGEGARTLFYPGSSIGNFTPEQALGFLQRARAASPGGNLLIGVDLVKNATVLQAAYDDALGVTAAFNLNVLLHVNAVLGSDFKVADWQHVGLFNEGASRIEMHLQARRAVSVRWPDGERHFAAGERIHTENSYKYRVEQFEALLREAGYAQVQCFSDEQRNFAVFAAA
jgi:L-histidine Nalpha-methyltransferase